MRPNLLGAVCALFMGTAQAASVTLAPVDAGTAFDANGDGVFDSILANDPVAGSDSTTTTSRGLLEFDLSLISGNVTSAKLMLHRGSAGFQDGGPFVVEFHGYEGNGVLETSDALVNSLITTIEINQGSIRDFEIDVTTIVQPLPDYAGFMMRLTDETETSFQIFSFADSGNLLAVDYSPVPIPPALYLFGTGLIGLIGMARRKAKQLAC